MKIGLISLGCAKNLVDSEMVLGMLSKSGQQVVNDPADSDVIIVNTCGFIDEAKAESIRQILAMTEYDAKVVVIGCLVERYLDQLKIELPEVDLFVPLSQYQTLNEQIAGLFPDQQLEIVELNPFQRLLSTAKYSAYLRISEGCNNHCTYCAIPLIRGNFKSRPFADVIKEAKFLVDQGVKELIVISQDTTNYGRDLMPQHDIVDLLQELLKIDELYSIRLLYLYPQEVSDRLIDLYANQRRLQPYFDLPIQHSADKIRKAMHRKGDRNMLIELVKKIRAKVAKAIIRTTMIVGFPGETDADFADLLAFVDEVSFDHLGAFMYSREEDTPSYNYPDQVAEEVKQTRHATLMETQKKISYRSNKKHIGEVMEGIVIAYNKNADLYLLRSYWNAPDDIDGKITFKSDKILKEGQIVKVKITHAYVYDLHGEIVY